MNLLVLNQTKENRNDGFIQHDMRAFSYAVLNLSLDSCGAHNLMHRFKRSKSFRQEACSANEESQWGPGFILRAVLLMEG